MSRKRSLLALVFLTACGGKETEPPTPPSVRADAAPPPNQPPARTSPVAHVTQLRRVKLITPARFAQRVDHRVSGDPRALSAADVGAIETTDILLVRFESDRAVPLVAGAAPGPVVFFNRVQPR